MAHVGVLKVMEEAGLRPDYITGVSMGSIVGGMYAIGYTADSLHKILKAMNWDLSLSNNIPENKVVFHEKEHFNNSVLSLPVTAKKIKLPSGLINGQQIESMLSFYAWPAADINDFSRLPIPFMCLGTDILTGRKVELKTGYLPDAMRASIAVPTIFTPIKIDTAILIDGGAVRNFAAEEVIAMGADVVIGSYVGFQVYTEEQLQSMPGIIKQIGFMSSLHDYNEQKKLVDLLIEPRLKGIPSTVFTNVDTIVNIGYRSALPFKDKFRKLADSLNAFGPQKPIENILDKQIYSIDKIEVTGNNTISDEQILGVLEIEPGEKIDKHLISEKIELLYGKIWFEKVKYRIVPGNDSLILVIDCIEKPGAMLHGSVHYDNYIRSGIVFRITANNLLTTRSLIDFDSFLGQFYRFRFRYTQFIDWNERFGLTADFYADNTRIPLINLRGETGAFFNHNNYAGLTISKGLGLNSMMKISLNMESVSMIPDFVSSSNLRRLTYNYSSATYGYLVNTLDNKHFPDQGMMLQITMGTTKLKSGINKSGTFKLTYDENIPGEFSFERYFTFSGNIKHYFSSGNKFTIGLTGNALYIPESQSDSTAGNYFFLGGQESLNKRSIPMTGFHANEIPVRKALLIGTDIDFEISDNIHLGFIANIAAAQESGMNADPSLFAGFGLGAGYMSVIGPLKVGIMYGMSNREQYFKGIKSYISIGYRF